MRRCRVRQVLRSKINKNFKVDCILPETLCCKFCTRVNFCLFKCSKINEVCLYFIHEKDVKSTRLLYLLDPDNERWS